MLSNEPKMINVRCP